MNFIHQKHIGRELSQVDKVFVPIHDSGHWFSALIDYQYKKIEIYDSWQPTYTSNYMRNIEHQKNAPLMLVSNRLSRYFLPFSLNLQ